MEFFSTTPLPLQVGYYSQASPQQPSTVPPNLSFPLMPPDISLMKPPCTPMSIPIPPCPLVVELPAKLFHTLQQPPLVFNDDDVVTTCAHCHQVNTLLDLRMKKLIQRYKEDAALIEYLRTRLAFHLIPGSGELPVTISNNLSYPHAPDACKISFNVDADEFRPSQKNRSTKAEVANVNNYESVMDNYEMQSHPAVVDGTDLATTAESGVDSGIHDSGVSDSGILDSTTIDSISETCSPGGDGVCNPDSRRSTESLHDDNKNQKKKSKKKDKRKKRPENELGVSGHSLPVNELEFVNANSRKPAVDSNQNYKPLDPKMSQHFGADKPTNERVLYTTADDELSSPSPVVKTHVLTSKTYLNHGNRKPQPLTDKTTNGMPERKLVLGGAPPPLASYGRPHRSSADGYVDARSASKYASSHRGERLLHDPHAVKPTNGVVTEPRKYQHQRMRPSWPSSDYDHHRYTTKRFSNSQYNDHGGGGQNYNLAKGTSVHFVSSRANFNHNNNNNNNNNNNHNNNNNNNNDLDGKPLLEKSVVHEVYGDLFDAPNEYSLAHCVAEDLRMSAGIAVVFRKEFGGVEELKMQNKKVGEIAFLKHGDRYIYYMITKPQSHQKPKPQCVKQAIKSLREICEQHNVTKLAMPQIGCGLDRMDWNEVKYYLETEFQNTNIHIVVYLLNNNDVGAQE